MKFGVKVSISVFNRRNYGINNNYVFFIMKINKMFLIEIIDFNNLECLRIIISIRNFFFKVSFMRMIYYRYKESDIFWEEKLF